MDLDGYAIFSGTIEFLDVLQDAGLASLLRGNEPYTVFAPSDQATNGRLYLLDGVLDPDG